MLVLCLTAPMAQTMPLPERSEPESSQSLRGSRANSLAHQPEDTRVLERQSMERAGAKTASQLAGATARPIRVVQPASHGDRLTGGDDSQRLQAGLIQSHFGRAPPSFKSN